MKGEKFIYVFYRGPLERSRLGFLIELFAATGLKVRLYWLLPHPKFQNANHRVLEPFMETYPEVEFDIISARFSEIWLTRKKVKGIIQNYPESITVCVGFTAPFFLPLEMSNTHIWCINGIPEESLLHRNSLLKRMQVALKWRLLGKMYAPDLVITVSNRMSTYVSQKVQCSKFISIPLCADLDRFQIKGEVSKKYLTYSGSGAPWQNLQQLSEVWGSLFQADSTIKFRVITRDPRARILGSQVPDHAIEFVGTSDLDELAEFLEEAEVGFLIRKNSLVNRVSFPTKLSEYLASGAWAVVSDIDWDVADVISKHRVGVLINPADSPEEIARKILAMKIAFSLDKDFESRLKPAVNELGKSHWLNLGKMHLLESGYFSPKNDSQFYMNTESSSIALLLVTYNRKELLDKILSKIQSFSWQYSRFVVVDNSSTDETSDVLDRFQKILDLEIIQLKENIGHGAGLAIGLDFLKAKIPRLEYVVFLEDDSIPTSGYLDFLLARIQNSTYTMISSSGSLVSLGKRKKLFPIDSEILSADFALFDGAIVRFQDLLKVGFPVHDWFMMFDDFEYCYRIRKEGFKIGVVTNPHLEILHEGWGGGVSHSHLWRSYYQSRNYVHFVRLHFTWWNLLDCLVLQSKRVIGGFFAVNGWKSTKMRIKGIRAGILGKKGRSLNLLSLKENT